MTASAFSKLSYGRSTKTAMNDNNEEEDETLSFKMRSALFAVVMKLNKEPYLYNLVIIAFFIIDGIQMLSFPLNPHPNMPFAHMSVAQNLFSFLQPMTFYPSPVGSPHPIYDAQMIFVVYTVWMSLTFIVLAYAIYFHVKQDDIINGIQIHRPNWPINFVRISARVLTLGLFVDVFKTFLSTFECESNLYWSNTTIVCWSGIHSLFVALAVILIPLTFAFTVVLSGIQIDRQTEMKKNPLLQSHGRVNIMYTCLKAIICAIFTFGVPADADHWFLYAAAVGGGIVWIFLFARYLPYHNTFFNIMGAAIGSVFTSAGIAGLLVTGLGDDENSTGIYVFLFTAPISAFAGGSLAYISKKNYLKKREIGSPYLVEIKARLLLQDLQEEFATVGGSNSLQMSTISLGSSRMSASVSHTSPRSTGAALGDENDVRRRREQRVLLAERDARLRDIQLLYEDSISVFSAVPILEIFIANFLGTTRRNKHLEMMHLREAEKKADSSAFDVQFFIWERMNRMEETDASSNSVKTSVLRRIQFDKLQSESENLSMKARQLVLDFWTETCEKSPDMARMQSVGMNIIGTIRQCDNIFRQLMEMAPQSAAVMRSFADHLLEIANDPKHALDLLQAAEQIEEEESKAHTVSELDTKEYLFMAFAPEFDLSNENVSLIQLSGDPAKLGTIMDANPAALKLFGYGRRELIGKNIDAIVPEPIAGVHTKFLEKYMLSGEETVINTSRIYYGLHRNGHIFAMSANIRPMESGFGGVLEEIVTSQAMLLVTGAWNKWKITGACKTSMALLGFSAADIRAGIINIDALLPGFTLHSALAAAPQSGFPSGGMSMGAHMGTHMSSTVGMDMSGGQEDEGLVHSPLMNELINASGLPGPGVDVNFRVHEWTVASAIAARNKRNIKLGQMSGHGQKSRMGSNPLNLSQTGSLLPAQSAPPARPQELLENTFLKEVAATAKLQECNIHFLPGPIYFLRWRVAKGELEDAKAQEDRGDQETVASDEPLSGNSDGSSSEDRRPLKGSKVRDRKKKKKRAEEGSDNDSTRNNHSGSEDELEDDVMMSPLLAKIKNAPASYIHVSKTAKLLQSRHDAENQLRQRETGWGRPAPLQNASSRQRERDPGQALEESWRDQERQRLRQPQTQPQPQPQRATSSSLPSTQHGRGRGTSERNGRPNHSQSASPKPNEASFSLPGTPQLDFDHLELSYMKEAPQANPLVRDASVSGTVRSKGDRQAAALEEVQDLFVDSPRSNANDDVDSIQGTSGDHDHDHDQDHDNASMQMDFTRPSSRSDSRIFFESPLQVDGEQRHYDNVFETPIEGKENGKDKSRRGSNGNGSTNTPNPGRRDEKLPKKSSLRTNNSFRQSPGGHLSNDPTGNGIGLHARSSSPGSAQNSQYDDSGSNCKTGNDQGGMCGNDRKALSISWGANEAKELISKNAQAVSGLNRGEVSAPALEPDWWQSAPDGAKKEAPGDQTDPINGSAPGGLATLLDKGETASDAESKSQGASQARSISRKSGSVGSGTSSMNSSVTEAIRRGISQRSRQMESSLINLKRTILAIFVVVGLMNVVSLIVTHVLYTQLQEDLHIVSLQGQRGIALEVTYSETQRLELMSSGRLPADEANGTKYRLSERVEELASLHQQLYSAVDMKPGPEYDLYAVPSIQVFDLTPNTFVSRSQFNSTTRNVNLMNGGLEYIAKIRRVLPRDYTEDFFNESTGTIFWILENGPYPLRSAFNESMIMSYENTNGIAGYTLIANDIVLAVALTLLFFVTVAVMIPAIHAVFRQKTTVFTVFLETPLPILRSLRASMESKLTALRRASEEADAGLDVGGAGEADDEDFHPAAAASAAMAAVKAKEKKEREAREAGKEKKRKTKARHFKRSSSVSLSVIGKFVWPMAVLIVYYVGCYFWKQDVAHISEYAASEVFYSHQLAFMVGQSNYNMRNIGLCDYDFTHKQMERLSTLIQIMELEANGLLYGDEERHLRALLKVSPEHFHLFMVNGCVENKDRWYSMEECEVFFDGLVAKGLQGAYKQFLQVVQRERDYRREVIEGNSCYETQLDGGTPLLIENLAERFLAAGFDKSAHLTIKGIEKYLETFKTLNIVITIASIGALAGFFIFVYGPLIRRLDGEIKNVRHLLLLFPDEVSRLVPAIIAAGRDLLKEGHLSSGASVSSRESRQM